MSDCSDTHMYVCICIYTYVYMCIFVCIHVITALSLYIYFFPEAHIYVHMFTYIHTCMHAYIQCRYVCLYVYMYTQSEDSWLVSREAQSKTQNPGARDPLSSPFPWSESQDLKAPLRFCG